MPDFRKGVAAIQEVKESTKGGNFTQFAPSIRWSDDKEERYVLFLTPIEEIPLVDLHEYVPLGEGKKANGDTYSKYGFYISRKDQAIGEDFDLLEDKHDLKPKSRNVAVAVELEPVMETVRGRPKPKGFEIKTREYERRIDPDDEDSEKETVTAPEIGIVIQSPHNFFGWLGSYNESEGPHEETPLKVKRRGKDKNTEYDFVPYEGQDVDLSGLIEYIDGINYLDDVIDDLHEAIDDLDDFEAAQVVASYLLDLRLDELADAERYEEEVGPLEEIKTRWNKSSKKETKETKKRPQRRSQRVKKSSAKEEPEETSDESDEPEEPKKGSRQTKKARFDDMRKKAAKTKEKK